MRALPCVPYPLLYIQGRGCGCASANSHGLALLPPWVLLAGPWPQPWAVPLPAPSRITQCLPSFAPAECHWLTKQREGSVKADISAVCVISACRAALLWLRSCRNKQVLPDPPCHLSHPCLKNSLCGIPPPLLHDALGD